MDGNAVVWCDGAFASTRGKTAHGLVRFTRRYRVLSVVDADCAGADAGFLLDGRPRSIPVVASLDQAVAEARSWDLELTHLVIGIAPDGGGIDRHIRAGVRAAVRGDRPSVLRSRGLRGRCAGRGAPAEDPGAALRSFRSISAHPRTASVWTHSDPVFAWLLRQPLFVRPDLARIRADIYPIQLYTVAVFLFAVPPLLERRGIGPTRRPRAPAPNSSRWRMRNISKVVTSRLYPFPPHGVWASSIIGTARYA